MKLVCLLFLLFSGCLFGLPQGLDVQSGEVTSHLDGNQLRIENSHKAILHWEDFSINHGEAVHFEQGSAQSIVLNRVLSGQSSDLLGQLTSNGSVFLVNPNGVTMGPNAQIQAAGFLASTASISNDEFLEKNEWVLSDLGKGHVINQGAIDCPKGKVYLIGKVVKNEGTISAQETALVVAQEVVISPERNHRVCIRLPLQGGTVENKGVIEGMKRDLEMGSPYEKAIHSKESTDAVFVKKEKGRIYLFADKGEVKVEGTLAASGGAIHVLGDSIRLGQQGVIDTSGDQGGTVLIGGKGSETQAIVMAKGSKILSDGHHGDGGQITIGSHQDIYCGAQISAQALGNSGNGGVIAIAGKKKKMAAPILPNVLSKQGEKGKLLLGGGRVTIRSGSAKGPQDYGSDYINQQLGFGSLTLDTGLEPGGDGQVLTVASSVSGDSAISWDTPHTLTLIGRRNVVINAGATIHSGGGGDLEIEAAGEVSGNYKGISLLGASLSSNSANITLTGKGGDSGSDNFGVLIGNNGSAITTTSGAIQVVGTGGGTERGEGIRLQRGARIESFGSGTITLEGTGSLIAHQGDGIAIEKGEGTAPIIRGVDGDIFLKGRASGDVISEGVYMAVESQIESVGNGKITIDGIGGNGANSIGILIEGADAITSKNGDITLIGQGGGPPGGNCDGIAIRSMNQIASTGSGASSATITLTGMGGNGGVSNQGILIQGGGTMISSIDGEITFKGIGGGVTGINQGIMLDSGTVQSLGSGDITWEGTGGAGIGNTQGIVLTGAESRVETNRGTIRFTGQGGGTEVDGDGIVIASRATVSAQGEGEVILSGTATPTGSSGNNGVMIMGGDSCISAEDGAVRIAAIGGGLGDNNGGLHLVSAGAIKTKSGAIHIEGKGAEKGAGCVGIKVTGNKSQITSDHGLIELTGRSLSTESSSHAVVLSDGGALLSKVSAPITVHSFGHFKIQDNGSIYSEGTGTVVVNSDSDLLIHGGAGDNAPAFIGLTDGLGTFNIGRDLQLLGGEGAGSEAQIGHHGGISQRASAGMIFHVGRDIKLVGGGNDSFALIGHGALSRSQVLSGDITLSQIGRDILVEGGSMDGFAQIGHLNSLGDNSTLSGDLALSTLRTLFVTGGGRENAYARIGHGGQSGSATFSPSFMEIIAGLDIHMTSKQGQAQIVNSNGDMNLVVDNLFPNTPDMGKGAFILNSKLMATGGQMMIYTACRDYNTINDLVNGKEFIPGPFDANSSTERWGEYFPGHSNHLRSNQRSVGDSPFIICYKEPIPGGAPAAGPSFSINESVCLDHIAANLAQLSKMFAWFELPSFHYHFKVCQKGGIQEKKQCACNPNFPPYSSFIFEDDIYWRSKN